MNKLINTKNLFLDAIEKKYAIGAFNFVNLESLKAILNSAEICHSPVIIQCSTGAIKYAGIKNLVSLANNLTENINVPVCLNLDHGKTFEDCKFAIDNGFTNVMIDGSALNFFDNIELTKKVVDYAHKHNVTVEGELGVLAGVEEDIKSNLNLYTDPQSALEFVKKTGVDCLAIAIGTSHGINKFSGTPTLKFDILEKIEKLLPNFPLVLHGASSIPESELKRAKLCEMNLSNAKGVPEQLLKTACKHNICKVNVDSDIKLTYTASVLEFLKNNKSEIDLRKYNEYAMENIEKLLINKMKNIFNSANRV